jgi:hypothetical protein
MELGNCFSTAANVLVGFPTEPHEESCIQSVNDLVGFLGGGEVRMAHGYVTHPHEGFRHRHAWIEVTPADDGPVFCFDFANGNSTVIPREVYYEAGGIVPDKGQLALYTRIEAMKRLLATEHFGSWDLEGDDK